MLRTLYARRTFAANGAFRRLTIVRGTEDLAPFAECGLVIEAVVEDLAGAFVP